MAGTGAQQFLHSLDVGVVEVRLSPVVLAEVQRQEQETVEKECTEIATSVKTFSRRFPDQNMEALTHEADVLAIALQRDARALGPLLDHSACGVTHYPASTAEQLVAREMTRRRPTLLKDSQSIGLRDQVIWDGCRDLLRATQPTGDPVIFVTNDNGFLDDSKALHQDLLDDLAADGTNANRVTVVSSLAEATVKAERYRELINNRDVTIAIEAFDYLAGLEGHRWNDSIGDLSEAPLHGLYDEDPVIHSISLISAEEVQPGNPATVKMEANLVLIGKFFTWLPEDSAIGELELDGPADGHFYTRLTTRIAVTANVEYDQGATDAEALNPRVISAQFSWSW